MAESDRKRLLERALALPQAERGDFFGARQPPGDADPTLIKRITDTTLRTKLVESGLAEGLQSPKGPQKIASIVRIYPAFDAPARKASGNGRTGRAANGAAAPAQQRGLPSVDEMAALIARIRELEATVEGELAQQVDERIAHLKRTIAHADGEDLEAAHRDLGDALERKRALASQIRFEAFRRIERDADFAPRAYLRLLRR